VVPRRPDEREAVSLHGFDRATRRQERRLVAGLRGDRVGIEQRRHGDRLEPVDIRGLVAALDLLPRCRPALDDVERREQRLEPRPRLDVRLRRMELRERRVAYEFDRIASANVPSSAFPCARPTR
jgi:hypothetical protein